MRFGRFGFAVLFSTLLGATGCGGGGASGAGGMPTPTNRAPVFSSAATAGIAENTSGVVYTAIASDPDGNPLTFSLSGGADLAAFTINAANGNLSIVQPPDFEAPTDADGNNVYLVQIAVSDGMTSTVLDVAITVSNVGPDAFHVTRLGTGFTQPVAILEDPQQVLTAGMLVVEKGGVIKSLPQLGMPQRTYLDLSAQITTDGERGLLALAVRNGGAANGVYVYLTNLSGDIELRRYQFNAGTFGANPATGDVLLRIPHPVNNNHNGGWLAFGPDGFLYLGVGDGGGSGDPGNNAQNPNSLLGKILRIDVTSDAFPADPLRDYAIPPSNPFAAGGGQPEIWALGLRNPFRASFDPITQNLWIGDVGQDAREEIDLMRPADGGANFGWRNMEGTALFAGPALPGATPPVAEYLHGSGPREGNSVIGGVVYRGPVEALSAKYIFGDFIDGNLWSIPIAQVSLGATLASSRFMLRRADFTPNQGSIDMPVCFGVDHSGNVYIVDFDGEIFAIQPG